MRQRTLIFSLTLIPLVLAQCPLYSHYAFKKHEPLSTGRHELAYMRPIPSCRTFIAPEVEEAVERMRHVIVDPDLMRVFENSWPSTLDTTIAWRGYAEEPVPPEVLQGLAASSEEEDVLQVQTVPLKPPPKPKGKKTDEELTFVITGDIEAMWLRDSANQLQAYASLLRPNSSFDSLASVFRGAINLQARYILEAPFCNAFQAPDESNIMRKSSANSDTISPYFDYMKVFSCNWELDSLASFLQLSDDYVKATGDFAFFKKFNWTGAVQRVLETAESMRIDSYTPTGEWQHTPYTYCAPYGGTPINECNGSPHKGNIGLVRSFHRPSDDACTYQYLIPSNMMFSQYLNASSAIMAQIEPSDGNLTQWMRTMSTEIKEGIERHGVVRDRKYGDVYAYEVDGYGSANMMDDPNIPSLLSAPFLGYVLQGDKVYQNTRRKILSKDNPYYAWGPVISGVGSPHTMPGRVWPMALIMRILTSDDDAEIVANLKDLIKSTDGYGVMHESVHAHHGGMWSRQWFSWANGMFGQVILDLEKRKPHILKMGFQ
ncbi:hypothetical protein BDV96DRAFT_74801 [Lophiotrema nucula]|uniref:Six-hairpin glycosidase-like protein n=1 Tax=Lophiotrema nucula TaxID=690887 RepID=A0A6A5Z8N0_9PLEO|nr:hypothetical protein BDV96DRAFT_74801 [Lophiotrema nucula]